MILQLPKQNTPAPRRSRSEIGGISTDFLEDAPDPGRARSSPTQLASAQANVATGQRTLAASATNADDELLSRVTAVLDGVAAFRRLHVRVVLGDVTVRGSVDSPFEKHLLFHSLKRISGAKRWIDAVAVVAPKVPRESWLTRSSDSLSELRQWLTPRPSVRWGAAICADNRLGGFDNHCRDNRSSLVLSFDDGGTGHGPFGKHPAPALATIQSHHRNDGYSRCAIVDCQRPADDIRGCFA